MGTSRSPGTQKTPKGPVQGTSLVDTSTGQPVNVVTRAGVRRLAVDAEISANIQQVTVDLDYSEDSVEIGDASTGAKLNINPDGTIDANVIVDGLTGTDNIMSVGTSDGTLSGLKKIQKIDTDGDLRVKDPNAIVQLTDISNKLDDLQFNGLSTALKSSAQTATDVRSRVTPTPLTGRNTLIVRNNGAVVVYFGDITVTTANGYPKGPGEELVIDLQDNVAVQLWAVCETGRTANLRILEVA